MAVQVIRVNRIPFNHYLPFPTRTITDPRAVQRLFDAVQALPRLSLPHVINCPVDLGLEFSSDFFSGKRHHAKSDHLSRGVSTSTDRRK